MFRTAVVVLFSFYALSAGAAYSKADSSESVVTGVRFAISGLRVVVHYNLLGTPGARYDVSLLLLRRSDPAFRYSPIVLTGDIGIGKYAGTDRQIVWNMKNEFPQGLPGNDFYFVVKAEELEEKQSSTSILTWIGAGAAVVAAAVTYVIVMQNHGATSPPAYPLPPGRPK